MIGESGGTSAGAHRVGKNVEVSERARLDESHSGGVVLFGFARETGDDIGSDGGVRKLFANEIDATGVVFGTIPTMHGGEDVVGGGLERHVEVFGEAAGRSEECDQIASDVERFDGTEAHTFDGSLVKDLAEEIEEIVTWRMITSPGA
jgi:hypothetical protein